MFAISERVSPWRARCSPRSVGRATRIVFSSCDTVMSWEKVWVSSPLGPLTAMLPGAIVTVTASGTATGFLPIRLISTDPVPEPGSPDVGDDLAAEALLARFVTGHHAVRGADDRGPGPALHARHVFVIDVAATAGAGDPFDPEDDRPAILGVLQRHRDGLADPRRL